MRTVLIVLFSISSVAAFGWASKEDCLTGKKEDKCLKAFDIKEKCWVLENRKEMLDCQVTCGTCDNFSCQNPFPENVVNCTSLIHQCDDPSFSQFMKEKCPYTCGRCDEKNSMLCHDVANVLTCQSVKNYCNSVDFYDLMSQQCASTCNRCPDGFGGTIGGTCKDHARDCLVKSNLCNAPAYSGLMARACAKTCNKCNACEDATLLCGYWVSKGFCTSMHYSNDVKRAYCRRSCNMCSGSGISPIKPVNPSYPYGTNQPIGQPMVPSGFINQPIGQQMGPGGFINQGGSSPVTQPSSGIASIPIIGPILGNFIQDPPSKQQ